MPDLSASEAAPAKSSTANPIIGHWLLDIVAEEFAMVAVTSELRNFQALHKERMQCDSKIASTSCRYYNQDPGFFDKGGVRSGAAQRSGHDIRLPG